MQKWISSFVTVHASRNSVQRYDNERNAERYYKLLEPARRGMVGAAGQINLRSSVDNYKCEEISIL